MSVNACVHQIVMTNTSALCEHSVNNLNINERKLSGGHAQRWVRLSEVVGMLRTLA